MKNRLTHHNSKGKIDNETVSLQFAGLDYLPSHGGTDDRRITQYLS